MAIASFNDIIANRAAGKADDPVFIKTGTIGGVTLQWYSYLKAAGQPGAISASNATAGGQCLTATNAGAIPLKNVTSSVSTSQKYLLTVGAAVTNANISALCFADILWYGGNLLATNSTSSMAVNSNALTRSTDGLANKIVVIVSSAIGATASNFVVNYTDGDNATQTVTVALTTAAAIQRCMPAGSFFIPLSNNRGVKSIQACNFTGLNSAGSVDIAIIRPLCFIPTIGANTYVERDTTSQIDGIVEILKESGGTTPGCIGVFGATSGTGTSGLIGQLRTVES